MNIKLRADNVKKKQRPNNYKIKQYFWAGYQRFESSGDVVAKAVNYNILLNESEL